MDTRKMLYILATMFAMRSVFWREKGEPAIATTYDNAYDMLAYVIDDRWDCLSQFDFATIAEQFIDKIGTDIDLWDLEEIIKGDK